MAIIKRYGALAVPTLLCIGLALTACSKADTSNTGNDAASKAPGTSSQNLKYVDARIHQYEQIPQFKAPGVAFDARKAMRGKSIMELPFTTTIPFHQGVVKGMKQSASQIGFNLDVWNSTGQLSQWQQAMNTAIARHTSLIDLFTITPSDINQNIQQALKAGTKVVSSHSFGIGQKYSPSDLSAVAAFDYDLAGQLEADWAIAKTRGHVNALVVGANNSPATFSMLAGIKREFANHCGSSCHMTYMNVITDNWATQIQPNVQSAVVKDPNLNYVIPLYDGMAQFVSTALANTSTANRIKIVTYNGAISVLDMVRDGKVEADISEPPNWVGDAVLDYDMRVLAGLPKPRSLNSPMRIFSAANVAQAGVPAQNSKGYGDSYVQGYNKLWKLTG